MRFSLREYRPEDFYTIWTIDQSCFAPGIAYTQFELKAYIRRTSSFTLIAESEENSLPELTASLGAYAPRKAGAQFSPAILGFLVAERGRQGHIITIDVRAEARKKRVGSALLRAAEERLLLWNCRQVRLETAVDNAAAIAFYKKYGYSITHIVPRYYSNGEDALMLEKDLLSPSASANVQK